jgi:hypothetical protein
MGRKTRLPEARGATGLRPHLAPCICRRVGHGTLATPSWQTTKESTRIGQERPLNIDARPGQQADEQDAGAGAQWVIQLHFQCEHKSSVRQLLVRDWRLSGTVDATSTLDAAVGRGDGFARKYSPGRTIRANNAASGRQSMSITSCRYGRAPLSCRRPTDSLRFARRAISCSTAEGDVGWGRTPLALDRGH